MRAVLWALLCLCAEAGAAPGRRSVYILTFGNLYPVASVSDGKTSFVVTLSPPLKEAGFHAGRIAKALAQKIGGSAGGRELFAQGGGKAVPDLQAILRSFPKEISPGGA